MTTLSEVRLAVKPRRRLTLSPQPIGVGGEATVFGVEDDDTLAVKLYHDPGEGTERRLESMLLLAHADEFLSDDAIKRPVLVWPSALVHDVDNAAVIGYAMRRIASPDYLPLGTLFDSPQRRAHFPDINWRFLGGLARNLAGLTAALHERDLVLGDVSHANLMVTPDGYLCFLDCDSMQFTDPQSGELFTCPVITPEYAAPELQHDEGARRSIATDDFAVAVLICRLLLVGDHPFMGIRLGGSDDEADVARNIADGYSYLVRPADIGLPAGTVDPDVLPPPVRELAQRAFGAGHLDPAVRPAAEEWMTALDDALGAIQPCAKRTVHTFGGHLDRCPWCERVTAHRRDLFSATGTDAAAAPDSTTGTKAGLQQRWITAICILIVVVIVVIAIASGGH